MAQDYKQLVDLFGPGTGAMMAGEQYQLGQDATLLAQQREQQAIREAQIKNAQSEAMNPLLVNQQQIQNTNLGLDTRTKTVAADIAEAGKGDKIATNASEAQNKLLSDKMERVDTYTKALARMVPQLQATPPAARYAVMSEMADSMGLPLTDREKQQFSQIPAEKLPAFLQQQYETGLKTTNAYRQAMDVAKEHSRSAENVARISATAKEAVAASKANKGVQTIQEAVQTGKMTAEKAAVALYGAAQFEEDPAKQAQLLGMAKQYEQFAMNQRNAQASGKVDVGAATNLPVQQITPALGGGPKLGTAENPIKLK